MEWNHDESNDSDCPIEAESILMEQLITDNRPDHAA
jgi:hypothetical protein